jgi:acyl carrier protein
MGLDSVELVMAVEEEFDLTIANADAARCRTPADVIALVARMVSPTERTRCRSQVAFHRLRRSLGTVLGIPRNAVKLDAPIERCIPRTGRRQAWDQLRADVHSRRWPDLERPAWLVATLWTLALAAGGFGWNLEGPTTAIGLAGFTGFLATRLTRPFADLLPAGHETVRSLVHYVPAPAGPGCDGWTRAAIAERIREITIEQLCLDPAKYREDADFVRDLGMD